MAGAVLPILDTQNLQTAGGRVQADASASAFGGLQAQAGENLARGLNSVAEMAAQKMDEFDAANAASLDNQLSARIRNRLLDPQSGYLATQHGINALNNRTQAEGGIDQDITDLTANARNQRAATLFQRVAQQRRESAFNTIATHAAQEGDNYLNETDVARIQEAGNNAASDPGNDVNLHTQLGVAQSVIDQMARRGGWSADTRNARLADAQSGILVPVVAMRINTDPRATLALLEHPPEDASDPNYWVNQIAPQHRAVLINQAQAEIERRNALFRSNLRDQMQVQADMLDADVPIPAGQMLTPHQVAAAFGEGDGQAWAVRLAVHDARTQAQTAPIPQLIATINEPEDHSSVVAHASQAARQAAARQVLQELNSDPMGALVRQRLTNDTDDLGTALTYSVQHTPRGQNPFTAFLRSRAAVTAEMRAQRGIPGQWPLPVFTAAEAAQATQFYNGLQDTRLQAQLLHQMRVSLQATPGAYEATIAQIMPKSGASAVAAGYVNTPNNGADVAAQILRGQRLLDGTPDGAHGEHRPRFTLPTESGANGLRAIWADITGDAYAVDADAEADDYEAFRALYASRAADRGLYAGGAPDRTLARDVAQVISSVTTWHDRKTLMPPGFNDSSFRSSVTDAFRTVSNRGGQIAGHGINDFNLLSLGQGQYQLALGTTAALDAHGQPVVIRVQQ